MKKILWFAQGNGYDLIYLTVFPKQEVLISLLETFGFTTTRVQANGEMVMERPMLCAFDCELGAGEAALPFDLRVYPRFL